MAPLIYERDQYMVAVMRQLAGRSAAHHLVHCHCCRGSHRFRHRSEPARGCTQLRLISRVLEIDTGGCRQSIPFSPPVAICCPAFY